MVYEWNVTMEKLTGSAPRKAYIYLPTSYEYEPDTYYPVLYMFDGHNLFFDEEASYGKSWGLADYLDYTDTPLIVAAVAANEAPDNSRLCEYSPWDFCDEEFGEVRGLGSMTMDFFVESLKPFIDEKLRTKPDREHTFIGGSSMGGLMSIWALFCYNRVFGRAAALSPSVPFVPGRIRDLVRKTPIDPDTHIFVDCGSEEMGGRRRILKEYAELASELTKRGIFVTSRIVPGGTHSEKSWEEELPFMIPALMYGV